MLQQNGSTRCFQIHPKYRINHKLRYFPRISGDKEMLKAALINVLGNAVKFTETGGVTGSVRLLEEVPDVLRDLRDVLDQ